jgi:hypothetical protein
MVTHCIICTLLLRTEGLRLKSRRPAILSGDGHGFLQLLHINSGIVHQIGPRLFLCIYLPFKVQPIDEKYVVRDSETTLKPKTKTILGTVDDRNHSGTGWPNKYRLLATVSGLWTITLGKPGPAI